MKNKILILAITIFSANTLKAQLNVGSTSAADPSAILQATSTTKGFLPPSMTTTQQGNIINPATGLIIYNSTLNQLLVNIGTPIVPVWTVAGGANATWSSTGNTGTTPGANYLGTSDNAPLGLRTNGVERVRIDSATGYVGIGTGNPYAPLQFANALANKKIVLWDNTPSIANDSAFFGFGINAGILRYQVPAGSGHALYSNKTLIANLTTSSIFLKAGNVNFDSSALIGKGDSLTGSIKGIGITTYGGLNIGQYTTGKSVAIGFQSGKVSTGINNIFIGYQSGILNTTGTANVFNGFQSGNSNVAGSYNVFCGQYSGFKNFSGIGNVFVGSQSGYSNTASNNTFIGYTSGASNTSGSTNIFNGGYSGNQNTAGSNNYFSGYQTGYTNITGNTNLFIGNYAGYYSTADNNQFIGFHSGYSTSTGSQNTFSGNSSGQGNTSGANNSFDGYASGFSNTIGSNNSYFGWNSGINNTTGSSNTAMGYNSGPATAALTNSTSIGNGAQADASNKIRLGNTAVTIIEGQVAYTYPSDQRFKYNIKNNVQGLAFIMKLRPVTYQFDNKKLDQFTNDGIMNTRFTMDENAPIQTGFLAQEVEKAANDLGVIFDGVHAPINSKDHYSVAYSQFVMPLVKAVQEQQAQIEILTKQNKATAAQSVRAVQEQQAQIENLIKQNTAMSAQLAELKDIKIAMAAMQTELSKIAVVSKIAATNTAGK